jgi:nucleotide-binding universal stress UspA family protein
MYKRCLAALDNSPFDRYIIAQLEKFSSQVAPGETIYAHVDHFEPEQSPGHEPRIRGEVGVEEVCRDLTGEQPGDGSKKDIRVVNLQGQPEYVLSHCIEEREVDLVCVGLKADANRFSQVGRRLLCMTDADVLFVPGGSAAREFRKVLIPVDLSKRSYDLVDNIQMLLPHAEIHIYFVNYIPSAVVMEEADRNRLIEESSRNLDISMQHFIDNLKSGQDSITFAYGMSEHFNAGFAIHEHAEAYDFDLIAIGRLSKLDKELPFLGSVTEKLLSLSNNIPVLVINH